MIRYNHLCTEHVITLTDLEVKYIKGLLDRGPLQRTARVKTVHDRLKETCKVLLNGK